MMQFSYDEITSLLNKSYKEDRYSLKAIGNHELNRHYVFLVSDTSNNEYVMKFYYKKISFEREYASLRLLEGKNVHTAKCLAYGHYKDVYWILINKIEGDLFENMRFGMSQNELNSAYYSMGEELANIHAAYSFDFFGSWDMNGNSYEHIKTYKESFLKSRDFDVRLIMNNPLPHKEELIDAIQVMESKYFLLDDLSESCLCHRDYDGRNILVKKEGDKFVVTASLDYEHAIPFHYSWDFLNMHHKYFLNDEIGKEHFYTGYESVRNVPRLSGDLLSFYLLCIGIQICSWAYNRSLSYYEKGLKLIRTYR